MEDSLCGFLLLGDCPAALETRRVKCRTQRGNRAIRSPGCIPARAGTRSRQEGRGKNGEFRLAEM